MKRHILVTTMLAVLGSTEGQQNGTIGLKLRYLLMEMWKEEEYKEDLIDLKF